MQSNTFEFLSGGGEMGALLRAQDYAATPLGPPERWPEILKTTIRLMLTSNHPMFIWWGPNLHQFYNDAYRLTMGPERHPIALTQTARECWAEIWDIIGPQIERVMSGEGATWHVDQLVPVTRHGQRESVWWTYGYSPIQDSEGVKGVLVVCTDVTQEHNARTELERVNQQLQEEIQQRLQIEAHQAFQLELADKIRELDDAQAIAAAAFSLLGRRFAIQQVYFSELHGNQFHISHAWAQGELVNGGNVWAASALGSEIIDALTRCATVAISDVCSDLRTRVAADAYLRVGARSVLLVPVAKQGKLHGILNLQHTSPYVWSGEQMALVEGVAERIWIAIDKARAYEDRNEVQRALALQRIAESKRLSSLFHQAPGFMCILRGPELVFEFANAAYLQLVGERELVGLPVRLAIPEVENQGFFELLERVYQSAQPYSASELPISLQRAAGVPPYNCFLDFVYQPIVDSNGTVSGVFVEGFDVTERRLAKNALQESEERLKEGLMAAKMVVWDWLPGTPCARFSDNAPAILGYDGSDPGPAWNSFSIEDQNQLRSRYKQALEGDGTFAAVVHLNRNDNGRSLWLQLHATILRDEAGVPITVKGVMLDITDRKVMEDKLRNDDHNKNVFFATLSHELRNPLTPIMNATEVIKQINTNEDIGRMAGVVERQVRQLSNLVDDLLDVSRLQSRGVELKRSTVLLKDVVDSALDVIAPQIRTKAQRLIVNFEQRDTPVFCDQTRISQVIGNVLVNASKYTDKGGEINLLVEVIGGQLMVQVKDTGIGLSPDQLATVFDLYAQVDGRSERAKGGLGIGLALVKNLVEQHGGTVAAFSEGEGKGSCFKLTLPIVRPAEQKSAVNYLG